MNEQTIWKGKAAISSMINAKNIILSLLTGGIWLIVPILTILSSEYEITDERIKIRSGILSKKESEVELIRIKDLGISQGIIGRILDFGDLKIISGDASHPVITMTGISQAATLKEKIREAMKLQKKLQGVKLQEEI